MEKFAVDLEKVLDEFEYNEEREENVSATSIKNPLLPPLNLGSLRQVTPVRPPAASYRRPSFEPINLADADFAASPKSSNPNFNHKVSGTQNENNGTYNFLSSKSNVNNKNYVHSDDNIVSSINNEVNINKQIIIKSEETSTSNIWQRVNSCLSSDEKPDLLENNSKNTDVDPNDLEIHNQLPDVTTSIRTSTYSVNNNEVDNLSNSLDLISSAGGNLLKDHDEEHFPKIKCDTLTSLDYGEMEKDLSPDCTSYKEISLLDYDDTVHSLNEPNIFVSSIVNSTTQEESFLSSDKHSDTIADQKDIESNEQELKKSTTNRDEHETQNENESSHMAKSLLNFGDNSDKDVMKIGDVDTCDKPQFDKLNFEKPIGFDNDLDVSEGELEEYLRELEMLDESIDREIVVDETLTDLLDKKSFKGPEENSDMTLSKSNSYELDNTVINDTVAQEEVQNLCNKSLIKKVGTDDSGSSRNKLLPSSTDNQGLSEESTSSSLHEKEGNESVPSLTKSDGCICESDVHVNVDYVDCQHGSDPNDVSSNLNAEPTIVEKGLKTKEKNKNPFEENDFSEITVKAVTSNNDFKEIESMPSNVGHDTAFYLKEHIEVRKKSTNPFEVDDEDVHDNNGGNVSEASVQSTNAEFSNDLNSIVIGDKTNNIENAEEIPKSTQNMEVISESVISSTVAEQLLNDSGLHPNQEPLYSSKCDEELNNKDNVTKKIEDKVNSPDECLPSSSSTQSEPFDRLLESKAKMIPIKQAIESPSTQDVDESGIPAEEDKPLRPNSLELPRRITVEATTHQSPNTEEFEREPGPEVRQLGKISPFWIPDTTMCMQCQLKFTVLKRRHHCRACGQVLCNKCCGLRARLEYMNFAEARVCQPCFTVLEAESASSARRQPNPNNPMEYCSTIPPLQQVAGSLHQPPPSVMVPVGVLKREGRSKSDVTKQVMFSDGIRPGGDLTELDGSGEPRMPFRRPGRLTKRVGTPPGGLLSPSMRRVLDPTTHSFIPADGDNALPPVVSRLQGEVSYSDLESPISLNQPTVKFALNRNLFIFVKRVLLDCCVNRECWCFSSEGLACVGQDEIVFLLECLPQETLPPKDVFLLINFLYQDAAKGSTVSEMSFTPATSNNLLGSRDHGGFLYIRTSYQCTAQLVLPSPPYLVAILIHRWETPWAKLFPIRLVLRLGAEFRYYPCPLVSVRNRAPLYTDIGHTIINILADFRKYSYTLPSVRGLIIHMEDRQTTINIPRNRYDQVVRALNNSNDSVLAFGANLSLSADSHLVCMQSTEEENTSYHTQAINIHNKPRKVTGASFVVFNGALKVPGLAGKSNIVEDGLMVQVPSETMVTLRTALRDMRDYSINCGPVAEETVVVKWTADDTNFNIGVKSCIDGRPLDGVPSIRVHNGTDYSGGARIIRWTEVFILQCEDSEHSSEPLDISRLSESIARATCLALVPLLDLLSAASLTSLAVRTTIHPDNVGYEAGSNGDKLPPLYMKSLDDELVAVVHQAALASQDNPAVLELVFRIMEQG